MKNEKKAMPELDSDWEDFFIEGEADLKYRELKTKYGEVVPSIVLSLLDEAVKAGDIEGKIRKWGSDEHKPEQEYKLKSDCTHDDYIFVGTRGWLVVFRPKTKK